MGESRKKVSVVFVTHNEEKFIVRSIGVAKKVKDFHEVVVIDGESTDNTVEKAKNSSIKSMFHNRWKNSVCF